MYIDCPILQAIIFFKLIKSKFFMSIENAWFTIANVQNIDHHPTVQVLL